MKRTILIAVFFLTSIAAVHADYYLDENGNVSEYNGYIVEYNEGVYNTARADVVAKAASFGKAPVAEYKTAFRGAFLNISDSEAKAIAKSPYVKNVYKNVRVDALLDVSVPLINADDVWLMDKNGNKCTETGKPCITGKGIRIGIIDTGVDYRHADLGGCLGVSCKVIGGFDFVNGDTDPIDDNGHGTHVASIAAGKGNLTGVAPDASIVAYKVLNAEGYGFANAIIAAIDRAIDPNMDGNTSDHLDVISLSIGGSGNPDDPMSKSIDRAVDAGVVAVVAAGNSAGGGINSPGTARKAITVGATDDNDVIGYFSSIGPVKYGNEIILKPDVSAPGVNICAAEWSIYHSERRCLDLKHIAISGTSMATPHVSGIAALLKQMHPEWNPEAVRTAIRSKAKEAGSAAYYGYGRVDAAASASFMGTPAVVRIDMSGLVADVFNINGTAAGADFRKYTIYYGSTLQPSEWREICSSRTPVVSGNLCRVDSTTLPEGYNILKLVVENSNGEKSIAMSVIIVDNFVINSPSGNDILGKGLNEITGTIDFTDMRRYIVEHARGFDNNTFVWSSEGISLENNGLNRVVNGRLATWDTTILEPDFYTLRFTIQMQGRTETFYSHLIYVDDNMRSGWPQRLKMSTEYVNSGDKLQPYVEDLDADGIKEIITIFNDVREQFKYAAVLTVHNADGTVRWTKEFNKSVDTSSIAIGDIDGDGAKELMPAISGYVYAFRGDGSQVSGWPVFVDAGETTISIADLNNDGKAEIIARPKTTIPKGKTYFEPMYIISYNGTIIKQILTTFCEHGFSAFGFQYPAIGNFDADAQLEIATRWGCDGAIIYNMDGSVVRGPMRTGGFVVGAFAAGDINKDKIDELIVPACGMDEYKVNGLFAFGRNGRLARWPVLTKNCLFFGATVADVNSDGYKDVIAATADANIHIFNYLGKELAGWPRKITNYPMALYNSQFIVADINNDKKQEIIASTGGIDKYAARGELGRLGGVGAWNYTGGKVQLTKYTDLAATFWPLGATPVVTSIDGKLDIVMTSMANLAYCPLWDESCTAQRKKQHSIYVWEFPVPYNTNSEWPVYEHDTMATARSVTTTAYKCRDTDGFNLSTLGYMNTSYPGWQKDVPDKCGILVSDGNLVHNQTCTGKKCYIIENFCGVNTGPYRDIVRCNNCINGACNQF